MKLPLLLIAAGLAAAALFQFFARYVYSYRATEDSVDVVLFGTFPVARFRYTEIEEIREIPFKQTLKPSFSSLRLGNRIAGDVVAIRKKSGIKEILLTPDDAQGFVRSVKQHLVN
jgi:hypothetical protein